MVTNKFNLLSGRTKAAMAIGCCLLAFGLSSCTDTWDDHYEGKATGTGGLHEGTLWQALKSNPQLTNFVSVAEATGFDRTLNSPQVLTVFAPTNDHFTAEQAQQLISQYRTEKSSGTIDEDNTVLKEFIQNHVALYNHSVSKLSDDSIRMMNGKKMALNANTVGNATLLTKNDLYDNGILFTVSERVDYRPNVFEYLRKDPDLDSLRTFLYSGDSLISGRSYPQFYYKDFMPGLSVPGSIKDGQTEYLDSVFVQRNRLFSTLGNLFVEDSTYIFLTPTNEVWRQLVEEYEPYFNYPAGVEKRDSMVYRNTRLAIMEGTTFSRTFNSDAALQDSAMSENCIKEYSLRSMVWNHPFEYYQYYKPMSQNGALSGAQVIPCSNGEVRKATQWNIDKRMTFNQYIIVEGEYSSNVKSVTREWNASLKDSTDLAEFASRYTTSDNVFYGRLWNNGYAEVSPTLSSNIDITYYLNNVLSNVGYDIYLVTAPALASDSNAKAENRVPTKVRCTISSPGVKDFVSSTFTTTPDQVDYFLVAEDFKFPYCTYGVTTKELQSLMKVETRVGSSDYNSGRMVRTMRIDCILLVPHGTLQLVDALPADLNIPASAQGKPGLLLYPHGQYDDRAYKGWYMLR